MLAFDVRWMPNLKTIVASLPGMLVIGIPGGLVGLFMGGVGWIICMGAAGALLGHVMWAQGARRIFLLITVGAVTGGVLAFSIAGVEPVLLGAASGGAIGGFVSVNLGLLRHRP